MSMWKSTSKQARATSLKDLPSSSSRKPPSFGLAFMTTVRTTPKNEEKERLVEFKMYKSLKKKKNHKFSETAEGDWFGQKHNPHISFELLWKSN